MRDLLPPHKKTKHYLFLDEVGRGCVAGPVVVGGVLWRPAKSELNDTIPKSWSLLRELEVDDSKKVAKHKRDKILKNLGVDPLSRHLDSFKLSEDFFGLTFDQAEVMTIEKENILAATMNLMQRVVIKLCHHFQIADGEEVTIFIDGREKIPNLEISHIIFSQVALPKADALLAPMGLASLFAKVYRDHQMQVWDKIYPQFEMGKHKGYGTPKHLQFIKQFGPCPIHRRTFAGVKEFL